jgi:hypothetical protein
VRRSRFPRGRFTAESDQIVAAMTAKGIPVTYVLFPDEGHVFERPQNELAFNAAAPAARQRTWERAAAVDRRLRERGGLEAGLAKRSFTHDLLLAVTAREIGATIITRNLGHFALLCEVLRVRASAPWP